MNTCDCLLSCGCWKRIRIDKAVEGEGESCPSHGIGMWVDTRSSLYIMKVNRYEWHVRCQEYSCRYGRWFGQSEGLARQANGRHASTKDHLGGVAYDRVTWDGRGSVFRDGVDRDARTKPKPPPTTRQRNWQRETSGDIPF